MTIVNYYDMAHTNSSLPRRERSLTRQYNLDRRRNIMRNKLLKLVCWLMVVVFPAEPPGTLQPYTLNTGPRGKQ